MMSEISEKNYKIIRKKTHKEGITPNLREFIEYIRPLGIVDSLKHILEDDNIILAEITLVVPQSKREMEKFVNSRDIYKDLINDGFEAKIKTLEHIIINKLNTIERLIEALESCIDIDDIVVLGWDIVDIETKILAVFGRDCSEMPESDLIQRLLKR